MLRKLKQQKLMPLLLLGSSLAAGCTLHRERPLQEISALEINVDNMYRGIMYESEEKGVEDMRELIKTSPLEEIWAFTSQNEPKWSEIGEEQGLHAAYIGENREQFMYSSGIRIDGRYLRKLAEQHDDIVIWHPHPNKEKIREVIREALRGTGSIPVTVSTITEETFNNLTNKVPPTLNHALPSYADLQTMVSFSTAFYDLKPKGSLQWKLYAELGITSFCLTEQGIAEYKGKTKKFISENLAEKMRKVANAVESSSLEDELAIVERAVDVLNDKYITVTFTPHEN